ncbi:MAG TPA: hypothetical protein VFQ38_21545 [Longimicrobiales bacterium]|nr:hypothetical protein [Longimicrobiales bacterium]
MHPQLEILLQIQDLRSQRRELVEGEHFRRMEEEEFHINVDEAIRDLDEKISEMKASLTPIIRGRFERIDDRGRAVVPVLNGTCYGCFTAVPTSAGGRHDDLLNCEHCGSFLYILD